MSSDVIDHKDVQIGERYIVGKNLSCVINVTRHLIILLIWYSIRRYIVGKDPSGVMNVARHSHNLTI